MPEGADEHVVFRVAKAMRLVLLDAVPGLVDVYIDRSPEEPLQDTEIPSITILTGRDVTSNPNDSRARLPSGVVVRMSRFYVCLTHRQARDVKTAVFRDASLIEAALYRDGQTLGGLVETIEHVEAETIAVLEGDLETSQRFIAVDARGLGLKGKPNYGTADVYAEVNG